MSNNIKWKKKTASSTSRRVQATNGISKRLGLSFSLPLNSKKKGKIPNPKTPNPKLHHAIQRQPKLQNWTLNLQILNPQTYTTQSNPHPNLQQKTLNPKTSTHNPQP